MCATNNKKMNRKTKLNISLMTRGVCYGRHCSFEKEKDLQKKLTFY